MITWGILSVAHDVRAGADSASTCCASCSASRRPASLPGIIYYLGNWYPAQGARARGVVVHARDSALDRRRQPARGLASSSSTAGTGSTGWQWLFLLEGIPAVVLGFVVLAYLTDSPDKAEWLAPDGAPLAHGARARRAARRAEERTASASAPRSCIRPCGCSALILFACQTGNYGLTLWIPQIVQRALGLRRLRRSSMISALPYAAAAVGMIADRRELGPHRRAIPAHRDPERHRGGRLHRERVFHVAVARHDRADDRGRRRPRHARTVLGFADALPHGQRGGRGHRTHQHVRARSAASSARTPSGFMRDRTRQLRRAASCSSAVLLLLAAVATLLLRGAPRARRLTAEGIMLPLVGTEL